MKFEIELTSKDLGICDEYGDIDTSKVMFEAAIDRITQNITESQEFKRTLEKTLENLIKTNKEPIINRIVDSISKQSNVKSIVTAFPKVKNIESRMTEVESLLQSFLMQISINSLDKNFQ